MKSPEVTNRQTVVTTPDVDSAPTEDPVLAIMPPKEIPVNAAFAPVATSTIVLVPSELASGENGAEIVPPDNPDHDGVTSLEDELFQFKVFNFNTIFWLLILFSFQEPVIFTFRV